MYIRAKNYDNSLRRVKIEFGKLVGLDEDKEAYVTLRELDTMTTLQLKDVSQKGTQNDLMIFFKEILPRIIITHNLYETENKIMTNEAVANFIFEKLELTSKVMSEYTKSMFRAESAGTEGDNNNNEDAVSPSA